MSKAKSTTEIAPREMPTELAAVPTDALRAELARGLTLTADTLMRLGLIWQELEKRGENLDDLRHGLARTLPLIAAGRLAAEAVVAFAGKALVLRALEGVPLDQQRRLANGELLKVLDLANPGGTVEMPLARLPAAAVRVVFGEGEVRTPEQQRLAFRPRSKRRREEADERRYRPRYDPAAGTVTVGRMTVQVADLLHELSAAAGPELPLIVHAEEYVTIKARLALDENQRLQDAAKRAGLPDWELVRKALRAFGLI